MKIHALKNDGSPVCGMKVAAGNGIAVGPSPSADVLEQVTCGACRRLLARAAAKAEAAAETPTETPAAPATGDEALRAIVREEISLGIEQLLRVREVADVLAVSKKTVRGLLEAGELSVVKVAKGKRRITASSVEAYIRRNTV